MSVVVIARDAARTLPATLRALAGEDVVVVDNGSRDGTAAVARAHGVRVVAEPVPGRGRARNAGVDAARGDVVLFTDADCVPRAGWADAMRAGLGETPLCGGPIVLTAPPGAGRLARMDAAWRYRDPAPALAQGWWPTANLGVRRAVLDAVGGFRGDLHVGEDVDLCLRARAAGFALGWAPGAVVDHAVEGRLRPWLRRAYERGFAQDHLHVAHGLPPDTSWRHPGALVRGEWALRDLGLDPAAHRELLAAARLWRLARSAGALHGRLARGRRSRRR